MGKVRKGRIFIVEDHKLIADYLEEILSEENFTVIGVADSAEDAFSRILQESPEILLLDVNLKYGESGVDLAESVRNYLDIPIVFLTSSTDAKTLERIKRLNAYGFVTKPFEKSQLIIALELAIAKHQQEKLNNAHLAAEDFFYYLSHSFRGALARILGLTKIFRYETNDENVLHLNSLIEENAHQLDEFLTNYLHYITTIDCKEIRFEPIDWSGIVDEVLEEINFREENSHCLPNLTVIAQSQFSSDTFLLKVVLTQLLKNALTFKKGVASVKILVSEEENFFKIKILDKGIGMDEKTSGKCFQLYYRGTEKSSGIGIGLNLAKKAAGRLNGLIKIVSVEHKGTCVSIILPKAIRNSNLTPRKSIFFQEPYYQERR